jgi:predicted PurR-regulated permease PerM
MVVVGDEVRQEMPVVAATSTTLVAVVVAILVLVAMVVTQLKHQIIMKYQRLVSVSLSAVGVEPFSRLRSCPQLIA